MINIIELTFNLTIITYMKRRSYRKPKRTFKRTRRVFKKRYTRRVKKYDGVVKRKIVQVYQLSNTIAAPNVVYLCVNWSTHHVSSDANTANYNGQREFV